MKHVYVKTPVWDSQPLGEILGERVLLKMEAFQPVGSFKARGMGYACQASYNRGIRKVVCASGGNAGYAVAYAGNQLGMEVTIVLPVTTPNRLRKTIQGEGAQVIEHGINWDESHMFAQTLVESTGSAYIHPFDDPVIWDGHASLIHELEEEGIKPGIIVVSVGGGGLMSGVIQGLHEVGWNDIPVITAETEGTASFAKSFEAGRLVSLGGVSGIATTLGSKTVTSQAFIWSQEHKITPWVVSDRQALDACLKFADHHRVLVEPACGAALSAVYERNPALRGHSPILVIVCGGAGITRELLNKWDETVE